jgi:hypothetical protein
MPATSNPERANALLERLDFMGCNSCSVGFGGAPAKTEF